MDAFRHALHGVPSYAQQEAEPKKASAMLQTTTQQAIPTNHDDSADIAPRRILDLNDNFRRNPERGLGITGRIFITPGIQALGWGEQAAVLTKVKNFDAFTEDNDPHHEHDFGSFDHSGQRIFWKIDYYSRDLKHGSPDPSDPDVTCRVLTVMLASEY